MRFWPTVFLLPLFSNLCLAQDNEENATWYGSIDAGYIASMGTTSGSKDTFRGKTSLNHKGLFWTQTISAEGISVQDDVAASEYQAFVSLGLGKEVIKTQNHFFKVEAGPGLRHNERRLATPKDDPIALLSLDYDWKISANTKFSHKSTVEAGEDSVITRVQHQLKQNITKVVALTVNHDYKNDNGAINTREGVFSLGLNYQF